MKHQRQHYIRLGFTTFGWDWYNCHLKMIAFIPVLPRGGEFWWFSFAQMEGPRIKHCIPMFLHLPGFQFNVFLHVYAPVKKIWSVYGPDGSKYITIRQLETEFECNFFMKCTHSETSSKKHKFYFKILRTCLLFFVITRGYIYPYISSPGLHIWGNMACFPRNWTCQVYRYIRWPICWMHLGFRLKEIMDVAAFATHG